MCIGAMPVRPYLNLNVKNSMAMFVDIRKDENEYEKL